VTFSSDPAGDPQASPGEPAPASNEPQSAEASLSDQPSLGQPDAAMSAVEGAAPAVDEGLPEWEPLTPELVEDEAIRGDFVIRWAVVGLALLFGVSQIADTRTLVHIKAGQYLAAHGVLPPANDVFSYTASDRRWVNLSWLFDLFAAGIHAASGGIGLSLVQGVLVGVAFGFVAHAHRSGIRTWWGSICAVLALLVCYPQFTMQPELVTLLGLAALLFIVLRAEEAFSAPRLWTIVPLIWLWSQFDNRAFLGWLLLLVFAAGESLRRSVVNDEAEANRRRAWWRVAGISVAVTVIHPFLWETWLSPWRLYGVDYPALRQLFSKPLVNELPFYSVLFGIQSLQYWQSLSLSAVAAIILFVSTLVVLFLNRERLRPSHLLAVIVFNGLACVTTHELAAASLVNCAICAVNAQDWYRQRFGQVYSVDWRELLFSRGGRAITVLTFFALAWLIISGRVDGPGGKRTGVGFDQSLAVQMDVFHKIAVSSLDDRPFHFAVRHGDLSIWAGQQSFVDHRAGLFSGPEERNLIDLYNKTRRSLQKQREHLPGSGDAFVWKATFEKFRITHVMPRLTGPNPAPDYTTFGDLISSKDWALTDLTAATAVFYRDGSDDAELKEFVATHRLNYVEQAFRKDVAVTDTIREWAKPSTTYDKLIALRRPMIPAGVGTAQHYVQLAASGGEISLPVRAAFALSSIREANSGLHEDPQAPDGYRMLGVAHLILDQIESGVMSESKTPWSGLYRYYQAIGALQQAALLLPENVDIRYDLLSVWEKTGRSDLALETVRQIKKLRPFTPNSTDMERQQRERLLDTELSLEEVVAKIEEVTQQALAAKTDRLQVAMSAFQAGGVLTAIRLLEEDAVYKEQNIAAKTLLGTWLLEAGRVQEAHETLEAVEQVSAARGAPGWRNSVAVSALANADYPRAIRLWRDQARETETSAAEASLMTLPFLTLNPYWLGADQYPLTHTAAVTQTLESARSETTALRFQIALAQLEAGDCTGATETLRRIVERDPYSPLRPLLRFYLLCTTNELIEERATTITIEEFETLEDEGPSKGK
jgi:tetratricopeptide (TPR) repeat protein